MYDPLLGRFISRDRTIPVDEWDKLLAGDKEWRLTESQALIPLGNAYSRECNLYRYVKSSPGNGVDPSGLKFYVGEPTKNNNTIVCDGNGGIEVQLASPRIFVDQDPEAKLNKKCFGDCVRQHEESHI